MLPVIAPTKLFPVTFTLVSFTFRIALVVPVIPNSPMLYIDTYWHHKDDDRITTSPKVLPHTGRRWWETAASANASGLAPHIPESAEDFAATCEPLRERVGEEAEAGPLKGIAEAMQLSVTIERTEEGASGASLRGNFSWICKA